MSDYTDVRLETVAGVVIAYLAPGTVVEDASTNSVQGAPRIGNRTQIARDRQLNLEEVQVFGSLLGTDEELPADHAAALVALFGHSPVTVEDQLRRIHYYTKTLGGTLRFYNRGRAYTATTDAAVNYQTGIWPGVVLKDFKESYKPGQKRVTYFLALTVGIPRPG